LLEKFLPHAKWIKIVELAAVESENSGNYEDAIKLYDLAQVSFLILIFILFMCLLSHHGKGMKITLNDFLSFAHFFSLSSM
jgi:hypothetical protein